MYDVNNFTLNELMEDFENRKSAVGADYISAFTRRLIDITYFDIDTDIEDRKKGEELLNSLLPEFEVIMEGHPEILKAYKQAYQTHLDSVKFVGIGSLIWKIQESKLSSDEEIARIIIDPSSGPLLPDYIATVDEDDWASFKPFVLKSLIVDRN